MASVQDHKVAGWCRVRLEIHMYSLIVWSKLESLITGEN